MSNLKTSILNINPISKKITKQVILISKILAIIFIQILINSCAAELNIMDGSKYIIRDKDKKYRLDNFKVVNVIDNRKVKSFAIGDSDYDQRLLILNNPLPDYLRMMFNSLISSDSSQKDYIPVTVYVDEFSMQIQNNYKKNSLFHKFSYKFEYPNKSVIKSMRIIDSITFNEDATYNNQKELIVAGIREVSKSVILNFGKNENYESSQTSIVNSANKNIITDTIHLKPIEIIENKVGILFNGFNGENINNGYMISYINMFNFPNSRSESGIGLGFEYFDSMHSQWINNSINYEKNTFYGLSVPIIGRYNLSSNLNSLFLNGLFALSIGVEQIGSNKSEVNFGARLEESIGFYLFKYITITAGIYQQGRSKYYDNGFVLSLGINGGY